jgi:MFS family permease
LVKRLRLFIGINIFWLALSMLFDGLNTLVLPARLLGNDSAATQLGLITFTGLLAAMLIQPLAGHWSDRLRPRWGRYPLLAVGLLFILAGLLLFALSHHFLTILLTYLLIQVAASVAQAAQQGFIPDLVPAEQRGAASGVKGFMDLSGAMLGFLLLGQLLGSSRTTLALTTLAATLLLTFTLTLLLTHEKIPNPKSQIPNPKSRELKGTQGNSGELQNLTPRASRTTHHASRFTFHVSSFRLHPSSFHRPFFYLILSRFLFLLGTYGVGRFLLLFVGERLGLSPEAAAEQAGALLGALALITVLGSLPAGWLADRLGRVPLMVAGALLSAAGVALLTIAHSTTTILLFGSLMALGSAAFASANWAATADLAPPDQAGRFFGLANIGTAGAAAAAGLFGPLVDWLNGRIDGSGYPFLFILAALTFLASALTLRGLTHTLHSSSSPNLLIPAPLPSNENQFV